MHVLPNDLHSNQCKERPSRSAIKSPLQYNRWLKALHPSCSLNAVLCYALALCGALYALHVLINVAWLRYK
ncbi:hypothetical protein T09_3916 [Trichinella sp. T9]|nr:hypothetical protein T09_3916 [Trichinella sp. T9]